MPGPSIPGAHEPPVQPLRWHPALLDHLRRRYGIRRVPRHTIALRPLPPALVWADGIVGQPPSDCLGDLAADADRRADDLFCRLLVGNVAVVPVRRVGIIRTLTEAAGHFAYPARAWREARPVLAWLCLIGGLFASILSMVAGTALVFAGVYWLFVEVTA